MVALFRFEEMLISHYNRNSGESLQVMKRYFINKEYVHARAGTSEAFWRFRAIVQRNKFQVLRIIFRLYIGWKDAIGQDRSALGSLLRSIWLPVLWVLFIVAGLYIFEYHIATIAELDFIRNSAVGGYLLRPLEPAVYTQLLVAVATVAGIFLGLYFTAISAVIASIYSTIPDSVRDLLIRDRVGNMYVQIVSFSTTLSIVLLAINAGNGPLFHLVPPLFGVVSAFTALAFVQLGKRAFFLSNPILMVNKMWGDMYKWIRRSTYKGWRWGDVNFQEHYRKRASRATSTLIALTVVSRKKSELKGDAYRDLVEVLVKIIRHYIKYKHLIPPDSRWFNRKSQHKQWYFTGGTELEMASQTDTPPQPKEIPDSSWLEDRLFEVVVRGLVADVDASNQEALYSTFILLLQLFEDMGEWWAIQDGQRWLSEVSDNAFEQIIIQDKETTKLQQKVRNCNYGCLRISALKSRTGLYKTSESAEC